MAAVSTRQGRPELGGNGNELWNRGTGGSSPPRSKSGTHRVELYPRVPAVIFATVPPRYCFVAIPTAMAAIAAWTGVQPNLRSDPSDRFLHHSELAVLYSLSRFCSKWMVVNFIKRPLVIFPTISTGNRVSGDNRLHAAIKIFGDFKGARGRHDNNYRAARQVLFGGFLPLPGKPFSNQASRLSVMMNRTGPSQNSSKPASTIKQ